MFMYNTVKCPTQNLTKLALIQTMHTVFLHNVWVYS